jgi:AraC-like DNA-binding protein
MRVSRSGGAPGTPGAWITPPPAPSAPRLSISGGFTVLDSQQRRLHRHAHAQGHSDLASYLLARAQQQASPAQLASELGTTTTTVVRHLLDTAGITPPPRRVTAAHTRRATTDQQLTTRAAELGFASLRAYLADRAVTRRWPSTSIASELGVQPGTVRDRLDRHRLPRRRATVRPRRAILRQTACWAAKRQARLAQLGFADLEHYLRVRRVEQSWSLRRMLTELQVGSAWLKGQMEQLEIPDRRGSDLVLHPATGRHL